MKCFVTVMEAYHLQDDVRTRTVRVHVLIRDG